MEIFGIGPMELILVLVLALLVFGPDQLPQIGAKLGKSIREMRRATRDFSREVDAARQAIESPMNEIKQPFQDVAQPFQDIKSTAATLTQVAQTIKNPTKAIRESVMSELSRANEPEVQADSGAETAQVESAPAEALDRREGEASPGGEPTQESAAPSDEPTSQG